jgi:exonuclease SbcC
MRPHHLRLTAFGPFAGTVEVDLDALSDAGVFLLHGHTGAGKTTLLDAMGFALYGRVPGVRNDAKRLRSDHASPETQTEVQLEATLAGRRVRITRSPEYERPKKSGTGTTTQKAKVLLEEQVGGAWRTLSTAHREAGDEIVDLAGMSAEQFFQVVLLPQGEFAKFLRADSTARAQLLEKLFDTGLFRSVEDWLVGRRMATSRAVEAIRSDVGLATARVAQAAGVDEPEEPSPEWARDVRQLAAAALRCSEERTTSLGAARAAARVAAETATRLATAQRRRRELLAAEAGLIGREPEVARLRAEADAARRAAEVAVVLRQVEARSEEVAAAVAGRDAARAALPSVGLAADAEVGRLGAAASTGRERTGLLEGLRELADAIAREELAAGEARAEAARAAAGLVDVEARVAAVPGRRTALLKAVEAARLAAVRMPALLARCDVLRAASADATALATVMAVAGQLREEILLAREKALSLRDKAADVREARLEDIRSELAAMLVDGDPCAVCGSLFHPDPCEVRGERVTRDDEDTARAAAEVAQREVEELVARLAAADADREALVLRLAAATAADIDAELVLLLDEVSTLEPLAATVAGCESELEQLDAEQLGLEQERSALTVTVEEAQRRAGEAALRAGRDAHRLAQELQGAEDLDAAVRAAVALVEAAERAVTAEAALVRAEQEHAAALLAVSEAATRCRFSSTDEAASAARADAWRTGTDELLRAFDDERAATAAALMSPELDVALEPAADVDGTAAVLAEADAAFDEATAVTARAQSRAAALDSLVPALTGLLADLGPVLHEAKRVRALADLCTGAGANALKMTLSSFVLAARLEEVAAAASNRLLRMTQGRYSLVHTDGTARGGARSGLGLLARDTWTGQDRETSTLSGGETFLASLALALGLTDVVTAEAGGARIEALFVDEGFGTLDEETLDEVMDVLDGLREGGRIVGLVSHVAELKQRIPAQVHVRKARSGSTLAVLGC